MKVKDLIALLQKLDPEIPVWKSVPAEGDSENVRPSTPQEFYLDTRYPALVVF